MAASWVQLNQKSNAEPNVPDESVRVVGEDILLHFRMNAFQFMDFYEGEKGGLRFKACSQFRPGGTNDEGWYRGQCRFSKSAPSWGEFYAIIGDPSSFNGPDDWVVIKHSVTSDGTHFLFYFRDRTFECIAEKCVIEPIPDNALFRALRTIPTF
jgi:hypothetical protein